MKLAPGQITLDQAQVERGERRAGGVEVDQFGNEVNVLRVPDGFGTFKCPREAVAASRAARGGFAAAARAPSIVPSRQEPPILPWEGNEPATLTPRELIARIRTKEGR